MEGLNRLEQFILHIKEYAETRVDLITLNVSDRLSHIVSSLVSALVFGLLIIIIVLFLSIGAAWWLGQIFGNPSLGFFCVGSFYLLLTILLFSFRNQWIKIPLINFLLKKTNVHEED